MNCTLLYAHHHHTSKHIIMLINFFHIALGAGVTYGATSVLIGHPIDTIKNKMQAQEGYEARNAVNSLLKTLRTQGVVGLYRGATPQFIGSMVFRSLQFGVFSSVYNRMDNPIGRRKIPLSGGVETRVIVGGVASGMARAAFETPIDYWKIRRQVVKEMNYQEALSGLRVTMIGRMILLPVFFVYLDKARPYKTQLFGESPLGNVFLGGACATAAWWTIWPLEYMKSQVQGGYGDSSLSLRRRLVSVFQEKGLFGLYRGLGPGSVRSFLANGLSMAIMLWTEKQMTEYFNVTTNW